MRKLEIDYNKIQKYLNENKDKPILDIYRELKKKKVRHMTNEEIIVYSYLKMNKRKLGLL